MRKIKDQEIKNVTVVGNASFRILIAARFAHKLGLEDGMSTVQYIEKGKLIIEPVEVQK